MLPCTYAVSPGWCTWLLPATRAHLPSFHPYRFAPQLHSLTAKRTQPLLAGTSGSLTGGIAIRQPGEGSAGGEAGGEGGSARARSLVEEQHPTDVLRLGSLASAVGGLVKPWAGRSPAPPPPAPIPDVWLEVRCRREVPLAADARS